MAQNLNDIIKSMSDDQLRSFINGLSGKAKQIITNTLISQVSGCQEYANINEYLDSINEDRIIECPRCHSVNVIKYGNKKVVNFEEARKDALKKGIPLDKVDINYLKSNGYTISYYKAPRYMCNDCKRTFMNTTGTIAQYSRLPLSAITEYCRCFINGDVLEKCSEKIGMSVQSSYLWRHKICETLKLLVPNLILSQKIEIDDAVFEIKQNGNFNHPIIQRAYFNEEDKEYVSVAMIVDRKNGIIPMVTNSGTKFNDVRLMEVTKDNVHSGSYLIGSDNCKDSVNAIASVVNCKSIPDDIQEKFEDIYNGAKAEKYTEEFGNFVEDHHGISPKYLNNYTAWHCMTQNKDGKFYADSKSLMKYALSANVVVTRRNLSKKPRISFDKTNS